MNGDTTRRERVAAKSESRAQPLWRGGGVTPPRGFAVVCCGLLAVVGTAAAARGAVAGPVYAAGSNLYGQLGDRSTTQRLTPVQVKDAADSTGLLMRVVGIGAGWSHSLAVKDDGTAWAWGFNGSGQLGDGTMTQSSAPVQVKHPTDLTGVLTNVTRVAGGFCYSLAVKADGTVWAWGDNGSGQLGDGTTTRGLTPGQVRHLADPTGFLTGVEAIGVGWMHSLAVKADGTVWAWGYNGYGQLGDGTKTDRRTPTPVSGLAGVVAIAGGLTHSLALKSDSTVWAWGHNYYGQLGDGTTTQRLTPVQVSSLMGVVAIASGDYHNLAVKSDGTVWAWGRNDIGQLGNGATSGDSPNPIPVQVSGLAGVVAIAGGYYHSLAVKADGTAWTWGANDSGQLGDGTTTQRSTPVQISGPTGVVLAVAGGDNHSLFRAATPPAVTIDQVDDQPDPTSSLLIHFRVIFSEPVTGFSTGDVALSGTAGATTAIVSGTGTNYDVAVSEMTQSGTVVATIAAGVCTDLTGIPNQASTSTDNVVAFDDTPPTITIAPPSMSLANTGPVTYTVTYGEAASITLTAARVTLNKTGTARGTVAVSGSGSATRTVTISGVTGNGTLGISIAAETASDAAGNKAPAAGPSATFTVSAADFDLDADADLTDFAIFQGCFNGPNRPARPQPLCNVDADLDGDADVDLMDFAAFQNCFNGPNRPPKCL